LNSGFGRCRLLELEVGTTMKHINVGDLQHFQVPVPALIKEQTAIANALSDVDALIASIQKLIAKKQAIKTATMQQLLTGKKRLPPFDKYQEGPNKGHTKGTQQTELGEIPEDWEVKTFGNVLTIKHGRDQKSVECSDGDNPILGTGGEMGRTNSYLYNKPSVLIGRKGTIDKPRFIDSPFWTVDTLFYSELNKDVEPKFVFYKFCLVDWRSYNEASGVPSLNASTIENIPQAFPCEKGEQTAIASILSDIDIDIQTANRRLVKTQQIKQGMMQELLTGKTRLPLDNN
jgi:type I restriction enzyme S subunit